MTSAELVWRNVKTNFNGKVVKGHERKVFRKVIDIAQYIENNRGTND